MKTLRLIRETPVLLLALSLVFFINALNAQDEMVLEFSTGQPDESITLPLYGGVDVEVDWGDGNNDTYTTTGDKTHTYIDAGDYTVKITGELGRFGKRADTYENADKLIKVTDFGNLGITSLAGAFRGASNLIEVPDEFPGTVTNTWNMFYGASSFNQNINAWNVENVENMSDMFRDATLFNGNISSWNVENVINMKAMLAGAENFNQDISNWNVGSVENMYYMFSGASSFDQDISDWNVSNVENMDYMFKGAVLFNSDLSDWNVINVTTMNGMFFAAEGFNQNIGNWDVDNVESMSSMFHGASSFNQDIGEWNVSQVKDMSFMFNSATDFNQDISDWDVSNVTNMRWMFKVASDFNQDIGGWDVDSIEDMSYMFNSASEFNQDIGEWNVGQVTNMEGMFRDAASFNQDIGGWDVDSVETMFLMFYGATSFNQDIGGWNVSNVMDMGSMFKDAISFNQDIGGWDVSQVTNMQNMFNNAASFNQDIGGWQVDNVEDMSYMFRDATSFNQDISEWNVSQVTNMLAMFWNASSFNQNIGSWNVGNVTNMRWMFDSAVSFDQDLGGWNVSNVETMYLMFNGVKLSTAYYNSLLTGWAAQSVFPDVPFHGGNSRYSPGDAENARETLQAAPNNWDITDGGMSNLPAVTTDEVSEITTTTATCGGEVTENGGENISVRGIVWHTEPQPTLNDNTNYTENDDGLGSFISNLTNLAPGTKYYVRAYATNTNGTDYGNQVGFTTEKQELTIDGSFTANNKEYDGTADAAIDENNLELNGVIPEYNNVSITNLVLEFEDPEIGNNKIVSIIDAGLSGDDEGKYSLSMVGVPTAEANITQKMLTITGSFTVHDKEYDGTTSAEIDDNELIPEVIVNEEDVELTGIVAEFENSGPSEDIPVIIADASLSGADEGNYTLSLDNAPTTTATIYAETSIDELISDNIEIFPNPVYRNINIKAEFSINRIVITNISGNVIYTKNIKNVEAQIPVVDFNDGLYIIYFHTDEGVVARKIIVQR